MLPTMLCRFAALLILVGCGGGSRSATSSPPPPASTAAGVDAAVDEPTTTRCDEQRDISRAEVDALLLDPGKTKSLARIVRVTHDGGDGAIRLTEIAQGSTLERWGFRNDDEIRTANGVAVTSPEGVLELYQSLHREPTLRLELRRAAAPRLLCLHFGD